MNKLTLRAARINAGLSVKEVAEAVDVSEDTIYRFETGKSSPKIGAAIKMAQMYGVSVDVLDFGSEKAD
jgi:putative transcriptional regulator